MVGRILGCLGLAESILKRFIGLPVKSRLLQPNCSILQLLRSCNGYNYAVLSRFGEPHTLKIITPINSAIKIFRKRKFPIVFATDAFHTGHFFFSGRMKPHSLVGTTGAEVIDELDRQEEDYWMPKPSMSAFFKTGLDGWLRDRDVTLCAVCGIATNFCVLTSAFDALANDFRAVLVEDCSAAAFEKIHVWG